jgi:hypothetical protein
MHLNIYKFKTKISTPSITQISSRCHLELHYEYKKGGYWLVSYRNLPIQCTRVNLHPAWYQSKQEYSNMHGLDSLILYTCEVAIMLAWTMSILWHGLSRHIQQELVPGPGYRFRKVEHFENWIHTSVSQGWEHSECTLPVLDFKGTFQLC